MGTYKIRVNCQNCGHSEVKLKDKGTPRASFPVKCPECGCNKAREVMELKTKHPKEDNRTW